LQSPLAAATHLLLLLRQFELEMGVLVGIVLCLAYFAVTYARTNMTVGTSLRAHARWGGSFARKMRRCVLFAHGRPPALA
jgi:hypothetical protein